MNDLNGIYCKDHLNVYIMYIYSIYLSFNNAFASLSLLSYPLFTTYSPPRIPTPIHLCSLVSVFNSSRGTSITYFLSPPPACIQHKVKYNEKSAVNPTNPYSKSKLAAEQVVLSYLDRVSTAPTSLLISREHSFIISTNIIFI